VAETVGLDCATRAWTACPPAIVSSVTLAAAAIQTSTAVTAVAPPGLARILAQPAGRAGAP
jgi:hypothetical protein